MYPVPSAVLPLPPRPNLEQYRKQAKELVKACKSGDSDAIRAWVVEWVDALVRLQDSNDSGLHTWMRGHVLDIAAFAREQLSAGGKTAACALSQAQFVIARAHGFSSWPTFAEELSASVGPSSAASQFETAVDAVIRGDISTLERLLRAHPDLVRARSRREHGLTLLHYVGANGFEGYRQKSPKNAPDVATMLLDAGAEVDALWEGPFGGATTLGLVATSIHTERAGVHLALLQTLLDYGASVDGDPGGWSPMLAALHNDRPEAARFLADRGARLDLEAAAGVGRLDFVMGCFMPDGTLKPPATMKQLESGFIWACEYGRIDLVRFLLDKHINLRAGEGTRQTALHLAAHRGQLDVIRILLARGAPIEARNVYGGTVLGQTIWSALNSGFDIDYLPVVELLVAAGAKIEAGYYPTGDARIDEILARHGAKP